MITLRAGGPAVRRRSPDPVRNLALRVLEPGPGSGRAPIEQLWQRMVHDWVVQEGRNSLHQGQITVMGRSIGLAGRLQTAPVCQTRATQFT